MPARISVSQTNSNNATAVAELSRRFPGRVETGEAVRRQHAGTLTWLANQPPDAVVWPLTTEDVAETITLAAAYRVPVIAFGAGTSLEGQVNAPAGGICLDLSRMDRIIAVNDRDLDCRVEAGVTRKQLNTHLRDCGLFFSVDPGSEDATLGGMAATRASGTNTVRYGTMRDNVISLVAVMADGAIVRTGGRARKSAAGYDLTRLLIGSEGTLGIITELNVRLHPVPEAIHAAVAPFASVAGACDATIDAIQLGLSLARIELLDAAQIRAVNRHSKLGLAEVPTLFLEFHGSNSATAADVETFGEIAKSHGASDFQWAADHEARQKLWRARHDAFWAIRTAWPGKTVLVTDVCVPISRLSECVAETEADIRRLGLTAPIVGHVGDGNFHTIPVFDPADAREVESVKTFVERLVDRAIGMDGTCSGEHGIGQGKIGALEREMGQSVDVMRRIKRALDPLGLLNPGKIFRLPD